MHNPTWVLFITRIPVYFIHKFTLLSQVTEIDTAAEYLK